MSQPYLGQVIPVGFGFAPPGWLPCDGRVVSISHYDALFSLLGTTFGGDGQSTFGLPALSGMVAVGAGQGPGLQTYSPGQNGGQEAVTLTNDTLGAHTHGMAVLAQTGSANTPGSGVVLASNEAVSVDVYSAAAATVPMGAALAATGGGQPHENRQPFLAVNYIIAVEGIFPSQN
jgi:microcystin-dependent protein